HAAVAEGAYHFRGLRPALSSQTKMAFHWLANERIHELCGRTLGIVGMGEIGIELARRARVMGMHIIYTKRSRLPDGLEQELAATSCDLPHLLSRSDYVCLAVPHTSETEKMIGRDEL